MTDKTTWRYAERETRYLAVGLGFGNYMGGHIFSTPDLAQAVFVGLFCWGALTCLNKFWNTRASTS